VAAIAVRRAWTPGTAQRAARRAALSCSVPRWSPTGSRGSDR
jgi:hypothetical protein